MAFELSSSSIADKIIGSYVDDGLAGVLRMGGDCWLTSLAFAMRAAMLAGTSLRSLLLRLRMARSASAG